MRTANVIRVCGVKTQNGRGRQFSLREQHFLSSAGGGEEDTSPKIL